MKGGKVIVNASFVILHTMQIPASVSTPSKFSLDIEVFDLGHKDIILGLSWLHENGFSVDVPNSRLFNSTTGVVIPCRTRNIPSITLLEAESFELEEGEMLLILDVRE